MRAEDGGGKIISGRRGRWLAHVPCLVVLGWWLGDLQFHWRALQEFQHGWLVVPLAFFLVWERWPTRGPMESASRPFGPVLLALAMAPLILLSELYQYAVANSEASSFILSVGCAGFLVALLWLIDGWSAARHFLFPIVFFFVAVPIPKIVWSPIVIGLQAVVANMNVEVLNLMGIPASRSGNLIVLPRAIVGVDEACSGIRSLQSSVMAALFIADLTFQRASWKFFFLAMGIIFAVIGNFGRSLYLSVTASRQGSAAIAGVHDAAGWTVLLFTSASLAAFAWRMAKAERSLTQTAHPEDGA